MSTAPRPESRRGRMRVGAGAVLVLALLGVASAVVVTAVAPHGGTAVVGASGAPEDGGSGVGGLSEPGSVLDSSVLYVHVVGEVMEPGLYAVSAGDRVVDAVAAAGGFTDDADPRGLNLARPVSDGEQLLVPAVGEVPAPGAGTSGGDGRVNLNTADLAALDSLPGIGPAKAQAILDWREQNGSFASVEDLLDVPGIGASTLEQLRELVTT